MGSKGRALVAELFRFHLVGAATLCIGTAVFAGMVLLGFTYTPALAGDYAAGILFSYFMNKTFTFRASTSSDLKPLAYTAFGYLVTFVLNLLALGLAVDMLALPVLPSQVVIMLALAAVNYLIFKYIVFGRQGRAAPGS